MYEQNAWSLEQAEQYTGTERTDHSYSITIPGQLKELWEEVCEARDAYFKTVVRFGKTKGKYERLVTEFHDAIHEFRTDCKRVIAEYTLFSRGAQLEQMEPPVKDPDRVIAHIADELWANTSEAVRNSLGNSEGDIVVHVRRTENFDPLLDGVLCTVHDTGNGPNAEEWRQDAAEVQRQSTLRKYSDLRDWIDVKHAKPIIPSWIKWHPGWNTFDEEGNRIGDFRRGNGKIAALHSTAVRTAHDVTDEGCIFIAAHGQNEFTAHVNALGREKDYGGHASCFLSLNPAE